MDTLYLRLLLAEVMVQSARRLVPRTPSAYAGSPVLGQEDAQLPSWKYNTKRLLYTSISNEYVPISKHIITLKNRRTQKRISTGSRPTSSHLLQLCPYSLPSLPVRWKKCLCSCLSHHQSLSYLPMIVFLPVLSLLHISPLCWIILNEHTSRPEFLPLDCMSPPALVPCFIQRCPKAFSPVPWPPFSLELSSHPFLRHSFV